MSKKKPLILVTNDDGITAPGIRHLISVVKKIGDVIVVAPDRPQSGMGHAITVNDNLYCDEVHLDDEVKEYSCSGTPADCVKIATQEIMKRKPDICVSGINHGSNSSINVIYSGTMSAAVEAGTSNIPAIGFSLLDYSMEADFSHTSEHIAYMVNKVLEDGLPDATVLNVNFPKKSENDIKGIRLCRQAKANWVENFDKRQTPTGRDYYWLTGEFVDHDGGKDTDEWALAQNYISVVPVQFDLTAYHALKEFKNWNFED
ncbi:5'/3'-nucleotidase SurE [Psychroflexus planctonicus]|uniref:5'-nucleotidase SurE n=1 Tax=Psychroflexus planctonicus TaxID=1526575 RepID=A0ABQ1SBG0_9FLAO|nr:5'/3'-nucleotidase SurE [Psychroflexus planctonicus]GGE24132.1 5'-nucleotidase SurE [Psychroflexus planctonicus]